MFCRSLNVFYLKYVSLIKPVYVCCNCCLIVRLKILRNALINASTGPEIWLEFVQYSIGGMGAQGGIERVRSIFERALTAVGLHVTKGASIWEAYREFEIAILSTVQVLLILSSYLG